MINGTVAFTFELFGGHTIEFLKIAKQTSDLSYAQILRNLVKHKGMAGLLDGYFPWGAIQCFAKGATFGFGHALGLKMLKGNVSDFTAEVIAGGLGGGVQGIVMSPLLLLKTRVMTDPQFRQTGGIWSTTVASSRVGLSVVKNEGLAALMKGSMLFSTKRVADWTSRFFFAEVVTSTWQSSKGQTPLNLTEKSIASLLGGALSATVTIPMDVLVATFQDASKAGQKMSIMGVLSEKIRVGGVTGLIQYSSKGYVARVAHVSLTTLLMKTISSAVYGMMGLAPAKH